MYSKKNFQKYFMKKLEGSWIQILNLCKNEKELCGNLKRNFWKITERTVGSVPEKS